LQHEEDLRRLPPECCFIPTEQLKGAIAKPADLQVAGRQRSGGIRPIGSWELLIARRHRKVDGRAQIELIVPIGLGKTFPEVRSVFATVRIPLLRRPAVLRHLEARQIS
jgi:hypothetical protein